MADSVRNEGPQVAVPIPAPGEVDATFLTEALAGRGHRCRVRAFDQEPVGTGQIGQCIRYRLELEAAGDGCPRSLIGKFPSDDVTSRETGVTLRNYLKEVRFYQEMQARLTIRTPACYYAEIDGIGPRFALILEDLAPARPGDQIEGCSPDHAAAAVYELIGLHAPTWNASDLERYEWLDPPRDETEPDTAAVYRRLLGPFVDRFGSRLASDERQIIERVAASAGPPWAYAPQPRCLVHIDYRLDNLLFDATFTPPTVAVVDWQSITTGHPLVDVAYFMGAGLLPEVRTSIEAEIVKGYHDRLAEAGVEGYERDRCWDDYRQASFHGFVITVIASMLVVETERGNDMFTVMAKRHARHAIDLAAGEFL